MSSIVKQVKEVIEYSQGYKLDSTEWIEKLVKTNKIAKDRFIQKMGGYIYEYPDPIVIDISKSEKETKLQPLLAEISSLGLTELEDYLADHIEEFYENKIPYEYITKDGEIIQQGTKVTKAFKYFVKDKDTLIDLQNKASMILQEKKITGTLCLSVHPLDFLSISENNHNWRSCHALNGEYRAGNLSYMLDGTTIVCYLKSDNDVKLPNFPESVPWNDKKWRCLLYMSQEDSMVIAGRQYPFDSKEILDKALDAIANHALLFKFSGNFERCTEWTNSYIDTAPLGGKATTRLSRRYMLGENKRLISLEHCVKDAPNTYHYNDVRKSSLYVYPWRSYVTVPYDNSQIKNPHFTVGAETFCLNCGSTEGMDSNVMTCVQCRQKTNLSRPRV